MLAVKIIEKHKDRLPNVLEAFDAEYRVDKEINELVKALEKRWEEKNESFSRVDLWALAENMRITGTILDTLAIRRRDIMALESERIRTAMSYAVQIDEANAGAEIEKAKYPTKPVPQELTNALHELVRVKIEHIQALEDRHGVVGGSLNYKERIAKQRKLLQLDIESAFVRIKHIEKGLGHIYYRTRYWPFEESPQPNQSLDLLDRWIRWHRLLSRKLEEIQTAESLHEITIPLATKYFAKINESNKGTPAVPDLICEDFKKTFLKDDALFWHSFEAHEDNILPTYCRIESFALSVVIDPAVKKTEASSQDEWRFRVRAQVPDGTHVFIDDIPPYPATSRFVTGEGISNRPVNGSWGFYIISALKNTSNEALQIERDKWPITDLRIHLRYVRD